MVVFNPNTLEAEAGASQSKASLDDTGKKLFLLHYLLSYALLMVLLLTFKS